MPAPSSHSGGSAPSGGVVSSNVRARPSRSQAVKGLSKRFVAKEQNANRYRYQGFTARIHNIQIHFRGLLEPHEVSREESEAEARIHAAHAFTDEADKPRQIGAVGGDVTTVVVPGSEFSSEELSSMDAAAQHSYFLSALDTYSQLNLHREFLVFLSAVKPLVASFPLLLRNKQRVIDLLLQHASVPHTPAQKELFTLMSVLARDLRHEFYPFLARVMRTLLSLLDPSDSDNVQSVFQTLAFLIKHQSKALGAHLSTFFEEFFEELLGHHKSYIRHFASESVAYLLRVIDRNSTGKDGMGANKALPALLKYSPSRAANEAFKDGLASTLFEMMRNIRFTFQTKHATNVRALLNLLHVGQARMGANPNAATLAAVQRETEYAFDLQVRLHRRMANYTRKEQSAEVWQVLLDRINKRFEQAITFYDANKEELKATTASSSSPLSPSARWNLLCVELSRLLHLVHLWSAHRKGSRIHSHDALVTLFESMLFHPALYASPAATVEWKREALSMLADYWTNFTDRFRTVVAPALEKAMALPMLTSASAVKEVKTAKKGSAPAAAASLDAISIENASLLLSFLETIRDLQLDSLPHLAPSIKSAAEALLTGPSSDAQVREQAHSVGLALLLEIHGLHPLGPSYRIPTLAHFQRAGAVSKISTSTKEQEDEDMEENAGMIAVEPDTPAPEEEAEAEEEEVDPAAYETPMPQLSLYTLSPIMHQQLQLSHKLQEVLLQHILSALLDDQTSLSSSSSASSSSSLLLASTPLSTRCALLWSVLQLLPASGMDVAATLQEVGATLDDKQRKRVIDLKATQEEGELRVFDVLLALGNQLTQQLQSSADKSQHALTFHASTPIETPPTIDDGAPSTSETNNHLLVAHMAPDQCMFLRAQVWMALAQMSKRRWSLREQENIRATNDESPLSAPPTPLLPVLRALTSVSLAAFRSNPTHIANVIALDKVYELAKNVQVGGVVHAAIATPKADAKEVNKSGKKGKKAPSSTAAAAEEITELLAFLRTLFSLRSFRSLSDLTLQNLSSPHSFLRSHTLSLLRYFTALRFVNPEEDKMADDKDAAEDGMDVNAEAEEEAEDAPSYNRDATTHSELVGPCPVLVICHDISQLQPNLEYEKEYVRLLKKLEVLVNSGRVPSAYLRLLPSFLLGLLHLKFNPLWSHVQKVLSSSIIIKFAVTAARQQFVWERVLKPKMAEIAERTQLLIKLEQEDNMEDEEMEQVLEMHAAKAAAAVVASSNASSPALSPLLLRFSHFVSLHSRSTDSFTYHTLLFTAYSLDQTSSGGKYGAGTFTNGFAKRILDKPAMQQELIEDFLHNVWKKEYLRAYPNTMRIEEGMEGDEDDEAEKEEELDDNDDAYFARASAASMFAVPAGYTLRAGSRKLAGQKLVLFLKLFLAAFHKTSKLPYANTIKNIALTLLTKKEEEVQRLALAVLAKYNLSYLNPYLPTLQALLQEAKWRDTMTTFALAPEAGQVAKEHRVPFAAILIRILYPKLVQRKITGAKGGGSKGSASLSARRAAILGFLGALEPHELQHLLFLVLGGSFRKIVTKVVRAREDEEREAAEALTKQANKRKSKGALTATDSTPASKKVTISSEEIVFEQLLNVQIPTLELPSDSQALSRALLDPSLYSSPTSASALPTAKQLGLLHMLNFFLNKLRTLTIPYLKFFVVQCAYMIINAEVQIDKYKGRVQQKEQEEESESEDEDEHMQTEEEAKTASTSEEKIESESEDEELDAQEEAEEKDVEESKEESKTAEEEEELLPGEESDSEDAPTRGKKGKKASTSASHALSKYLSELRQIRQLAFARLASMLEFYPTLFEDAAADHVPAFQAPEGAITEAKQRLLKMEGPSLAPYLRFVLAISWPSLLRLSTEGTQHMGGLWSMMLHMSAHHYLLVNFLHDKQRMLRMEWQDPAHKKGLQLQLIDAHRLVLHPSGNKMILAEEGQTTHTRYPLFTLLQSSLGARSVHSSVVSALLSVSENLLEAKEDAMAWPDTLKEMEELESERREKKRLQSERAKDRSTRRQLNRASRKAMLAASGRPFADESSDDDADMESDDEAISHRLVQIETLHLSPTSHATRVRQHFLWHYRDQLKQVWEHTVEAYLANMHRWIAHLSIMHHAAAGKSLSSVTHEGNKTMSKSEARKLAALQLAKKMSGTKGASKTAPSRRPFFPRRELEILSQIAPFASKASTAKMLIDLLVPFLHSPERSGMQLSLHQQTGGTKKGWDRAKAAPPSLHSTLLRILLHLAPLLPVAHIENLLEGLHRLLFSLKNSQHRSLMTELYTLLAEATTNKMEDAQAKASSLLPLLAATLKGLNAMNPRRLDEYDDQLRLEVYAALEGAFERRGVEQEIGLLRDALGDESREFSEKKRAELQARLEELEQKQEELVQQQKEQEAVAAAAASTEETTIQKPGSTLLVTLPAASAASHYKSSDFDLFFSSYFSSDLSTHQKAVGMLRPLLHNLMHDLLDEDLGTRSSASSMLKKLVAFLALPHQHATVQADELNKVVQQNAEQSEVQTAIKLQNPLHLLTPSSLIRDQLYPLLKRSLKHPQDKIRREVVLLLRTLILSYPVFYRHMLLLVDVSRKQPELDFLENIVHIQLHARRKALTRLFQRITVQDDTNPDVFHAHPEKAVEVHTIRDILLPLLHHFIYDTSGAMANISGGVEGAMSLGFSGSALNTARARKKAGAETNLLEEALKLAGKLSAYLPWSAYYHQLQVYLKLMRVKPNLERVLVRLVCNFIREWHFEVAATPDEIQEAVETKLRTLREELRTKRMERKMERRRERQAQGVTEDTPEQQEQDEMEDAALEEEHNQLMTAAAAEAATQVEAATQSVTDSPTAALSHKIRALLTTRLLPSLHSLLTSFKVKQVRASKDAKAGKQMQTTYDNQNELTSLSGMTGGVKEGGPGLELVRVPVAMALVALLRKLPESLFNLEFPRLLTALAQQLSHREQQARDLTRSTLLEILQLLGPFYFHFFLEELRRTLVNGYQLHVLGHMVHAMLDVLVSKGRVPVGSIDHSIPTLMDVLMDQLLGEPAKQKEVAAIRTATKEARVNHAPDCFQLLAQVITFPGTIHYLVDPFRFKLAHDTSLRLKELNIIADVLKRIALGLHANPSVQEHQQELLVYVHNYLFRNAQESFAALFPESGEDKKLSKAQKKATAAMKGGRYRKLDLEPEKTPLEAIRAENKARSEGIFNKSSQSVSSRKAIEFLAALQASVAGQSSYEKSIVKSKPTKDDTFLIPRAPAPGRNTWDSSDGAASVAIGHHSNLILVFGLNLLYLTLKGRKIQTNLQSNSVDRQSVANNLSRLDPFLHLIRDYCLVMGSDVGAESTSGSTKSKVTKEGTKKTSRTVVATSSSAVIHVALKCSEYMLQMGELPSLPLYLRDLTNYMFALIHSKAAPHILAACYRNLSVILKTADWKACGISHEKLRLLLRFIQAEVMSPSVTPAALVAFKLLHAILSRGAELPELYDFILVVGELMVTSPVDEVRKQCSAAFYTFLYNYKLGAGRMQTHLAFLLNQLQYPHASGRATVLTLLHSIFSHFAPAVLEEQLEFLFLPLVVHQANEADEGNKKLLHQALSTLLSKMSSTKINQVAKMVYGWWKEEDEEEEANKKGKKGKQQQAVAASSSGPRTRSPQSQLLQYASLHVLCILIDLLKADFTGPLLLGRSVTGLTAIMREKVTEFQERERRVKEGLEEEQQEESGEKEGDNNEDEEATNVGASWRVLYSALLAFEKLFRHLPSAQLAAHLQQHVSGFFTDLLLPCLLYPHTWVRTISTRIVGFIVAAIPMASFTPQNARTLLSSSLLSSPSTFFQLLRTHTTQLTSPHLTEALADQLVKNLVWVAISAHNIGAGDIWEKLEGDKEEEEEEKPEEEDEEAAEGEDAMEDDSAAPSSKKRKQPSSSSSSSTAAFPKSNHRILNWMFTRLSYMCRHDPGIRMRESIFRLFATLCSQLPVPVFSCFLLQVINPLFRVAESPVAKSEAAAAANPQEAELAQFATSVMELIQNGVGTPVFLQAYSYVRTQVAKVRQQRSAKRKNMAVINPAQAAVKKQAKHDKKRVSKKRKIQALKQQLPQREAQMVAASKKQRMEQS